jgi:hypothetical protein
VAGTNPVARAEKPSVLEVVNPFFTEDEITARPCLIIDGWLMACRSLIGWLVTQAVMLGYR